MWPASKRILVSMGSGDPGPKPAPVTPDIDTSEHQPGHPAWEFWRYFAAFCDR